MTQDAAPHTFVAESRELLRDMEDALLTLEQAPGDADAINAVFRAMHTIKGSAGVFGFDVIVEFTHVMEGVIEEVRAGRAGVDGMLVALLLACGDHVSLLIDCLESPDRLAKLEAARSSGTDLLLQLQCYRESACEGDAAPGLESGLPAAEASAAGAGSVASGAWHLSIRFGRAVLQHGMDPLSFIRYLSTLGEVDSVTASFDAMPEASTMDPQACYVGLEIQFSGTVSRQDLEGAFEYVRDDSTIRILPPHAPIAEYMDLIRSLPEDQAKLHQTFVECGALTPGELEQGLKMSDTQLSQACGTDNGTVSAGPHDSKGAAGIPAAQEPGKARNGADSSRYVRVHAGKLDELINLVGELVIASAGVNLCARDGGSDLREATASMSRLVEEVRDGALTLRMVPIGDTFNRFKRVVHDLGRELGKDVELVITGADTELDKSMVEKLSDPLMHLVRNALDHGIESTSARLLRGKPARGKLQLNAYHETGSIVIEVHDDGGGLDRERILARAVERGLAQPGQALSDREIFQLIMEPGFSTADELTSISGRGFGMDVVRRNIEALRGTVTIDSAAGEGTGIALRVPLTLAIIDGFLVGVGSATCVVPLEMVVECLEFSAEDRQGAREGGYINLRGELLPLLRLRDVFDTQGEPGKRENIVVVQYAGRRAGFVVDALLGEFQTVIKPLGKLFERLAGISGSTILGTGEVALILDVQALVERAERSESARTAVTGEHRTWSGSGSAPEKPSSNIERRATC